MKLKELSPGQIVAVRTYGDSWKLAQIVEVGTYTKTVYHGRSFYGTKTAIKGVKVAYQNRDGNYPLTKIERNRVFGKDEETFIDPFDGATVVVPATEDRFEEVEVPATEWVRPQDVLMTEEAAEKQLEAKREREARLARVEEKTAEMHPHIQQKLVDAGVSKYNAREYPAGGKVELSYNEFIAVIASEIAKFAALEDKS